MGCVLRALVRRGPAASADLIYGLVPPRRNSSIPEMLMKINLYTWKINLYTLYLYL